MQALGVRLDLSTPLRVCVCGLSPVGGSIGCGDDDLPGAVRGLLALRQNQLPLGILHALREGGGRGELGGRVKRKEARSVEEGGNKK